MIQLLCIDVDGTLSDGKIYLSSDNSGFISENTRSFCVKDGLGLAYWNSIGKISAIVTGRSSPIIESRAKEIGVHFVFMGVKDKGKCVRELQSRLDISRESCAAIGDDVNDLPMFREVSLSFVPNDCVPAVVNKANIKLSNNGGNGAVREAIEYILKQEDLYEEFIKCWQ